MQFLQDDGVPEHIVDAMLFLTSRRASSRRGAARNGAWRREEPWRSRDISPKPAARPERLSAAARRAQGRKTWQLTRQWKLTQFGDDMVELPPGAWSTNRHWHRNNDELVIVISASWWQ